jgi:hypothetical protein
MNKIIVRWWPPYSTGYKDQPVECQQEAEIMQDWFRKNGVHSEIIRIMVTEILVRQ